MSAGRLPPEYVCVCRHSSGSLWLAPDHLLAVASSGFAEDYLRIALRDVKGAFLLVTDRRLYWAFPSALIGACSGLVLGVALLTRSPGDHGPRVSLVLFALSVIVFFVNQLKGQGCTGYLVTDVQTLKLPGFRRRKPARAAMERLTVAIRSSQPSSTAP